MKRLEFRLAMHKKKHSPWPQTSFRSIEFESRVSFSARIHPPLELEFPRGGHLFRRCFFSISLVSQLSDERFPICTSIFSLHSLGYYTPQRVPRIFPLGWRGVDSLELAVAVASLAVLPQFSTSRRWASELVQIPMRPQEQRKPITDSSCAIS